MRADNHEIELAHVLLGVQASQGEVHVGLATEAFAEQFHHVCVALLGGDHPEVRQRPGVPRVGVEDLAVEPLGRVQVPRLVRRHRPGERLLHRRHGVPS